MYAGVDGYPTHQSDPSKTKFAPRAGFAWSINDKTVLRGGYGLFWAPYQYAFPTENRLGARGFTEVTDYVASFDGGLTPCPTCNIVNPFPNGFDQPTGSARGILTGAGGSINFVDQFRKSPYVHQYSFDLQREVPNRIVVGIGYIGSTTRRIGVGGNDSERREHQPARPAVPVAWARRCWTQVPNPFFGNPAFGAFANQETISRGQLLRPYPQFGDLLAHQVSEGRAQYHSVVLRLERPIVSGWGGRMSYTYSQNKNNIFGETNAFSGARQPGPHLNAYDLDREYAYSLSDTPHRLVFAGTFELPFGKNKKHLSEPGLARVLFGGWSITGVGTYQSGFPSVVTQANINSGVFGRLQRPNLTGTSSLDLGQHLRPLRPGLRLHQQLVQRRRVDGGSGLHLRQRPAHGHRHAHAVQGADRHRVPEGRADRPRGADDPLRDDQHLQQRPVQLAQHEFGSSQFGTITGTRGFPRLLQLTLRYAF